MKNLFTQLITPVLSILLLALVLTSCSGTGEQNAADTDAESLEVVCSTFPVYIITSNVTAGIEGIETSLLIPAALGCPHDYSLRPQDMQRLAQANALVINGLGMEEFLGAPVARANAELPIIDASHGIEQVLNYSEMPALTGDGSENHDHTHHDHDHTDHDHNHDHTHHDHDHADHDHSHDHNHHDHDHDHTGVNPHTFASPLMAAKMAENIAAGLAELHPEHASVFKANATAFAEQMRFLNQEIAATVADSESVRLVAQHGIFDYLARDVGLEIVAVIQPHGGHEPSAHQLRTAVERVRELGAIAVVAEPQYPTRIAETVAREAGVPFAVLDPVSTGPADAGPGYFAEIMRNNITVLEELLKR